MRTDVYDKIIELCEASLRGIPEAKSHEQLGLQVINQLMTIIGVCGGAKAAEKEN